MFTISLTSSWSGSHSSWLSVLLLLRGRRTYFLFRATFSLFIFLILKSLLRCLLLKSLLLHFLLLLHLDLSFPLLVSLLLLKKCITYLFGQVEIDSIIFNKPRKRLPAIIYLTKLYKKGNEIKQLSVLGIVIPGDNRHSTLWLKHVRRGRVVKNYGVLHVPSNFRHVLREYSVDVGTMLSEKSHSTIPIRVHKVHERVGVLTQTCRKNDQFEMLGHSFQKVVDSRPLGHENVAHVPLYVHRDSIVWAFDLIELRVHQSFIEIKH